MESSYAATASTMARPPNDGMGCYINAVMVAIFGPNNPWLTRTLTTPLVSDSGEVKALRQAVTAYAKDLRYQASGSKEARPDTLRRVLKEWPKLAPSLSQEARASVSSSANEFLEVLLDTLVPKPDHLVHSRQEKVEWNGDHGVVAFDRYFRWVSKASSPSGPLTTLAEPSPSWTPMILQDLSKRPARKTLFHAQTSPYFSFGLADFPEGSLVTLPTITSFSTLSTLAKPMFDFYIDKRPYRVKGQSILEGHPPSSLTLDTLLQVAKDLLPSLQTGQMSQKMIHFIRQDPALLLKVIDWLVVALGLTSQSSTYEAHTSPKFKARGEKGGEAKAILLIGLMMEALYLVGKPHIAASLYQWALNDFGKQESWILLDHLKECLDRVGQGLSYASPGRLTGTMVTSDSLPHWIFSTRTTLTLHPSPSGDQGLVLSLTPSPRRFFGMVDSPSEFLYGDAVTKKPMILSLPSFPNNGSNQSSNNGSNEQQSFQAMRLVGVVEYMGSRSMTVTRPSNYSNYHQAAGHYRAWFYAAPSPSDRKDQWFVYDDMMTKGGPQGVEPEDLKEVMRGWSAFGVAFFYIPLSVSSPPYDDKKAPAYRLPSSFVSNYKDPSRSPITTVSPSPTLQVSGEEGHKRLQAFLAASPKALYSLKTDFSTKTPKHLPSSLAILFPLLNEGSHPAWDIDQTTLDILKDSPRFRQVQYHGLKEIQTYWGLKDFQIKDAPRYERLFVHSKDSYRGLSRVLRSLALMGRTEERDRLAYLVAQDLLANPSSVIREKAEFLRSEL